MNTKGTTMKPTLTLLTALLLTPLAALPAAEAPTQKPNVVLFLVDDMGWMDSTPYGSQYYETPQHGAVRPAGDAVHRCLRRAAVLADAGVDSDRPILGPAPRHQCHRASARRRPRVRRPIPRRRLPAGR